MCDIYKYDGDNYQIDGDMFCRFDLDTVSTWDEVRDLLGIEQTKQMKEFGFRPDELSHYLDRASKATV